METRNNGTTNDAASLLQFLQICGKLKTEKRTGWVHRSVQLPESISDHMYRMAILSFLITDNSLNKDKCMKIALVHDMAEALVGDIAPHQNISKQEKHKMELEAMEKIRDTVGGTIGQEIFSLWNEYEEQSTPEANIVKQFDKFEMILQAFEYEKGLWYLPYLQPAAQGIRLQDFYNSTNGQFKHPQLLSWVEQLYKLRQDEVLSKPQDI